MAKGIQGGGLPPRAVAVTFDDGYSDNLYQAKPLLEQYGVPATVFLSTGYIGLGHEFWWDELEQVCLQPGTLPDILELTIDGERHRWDLSDAVRYDASESERHRRWSASDEAPTPRHALYRSLWQLLQPLNDEDRRSQLEAIWRWAGRDPLCRSTHRTLSVEEVKTLSVGPWVQIGAHTVTHPTLSTKPVDQQRKEIEQSKRRLEQILGVPVTCFAYPFGDYAFETIPLVGRAGFLCACSTESRVVEPGVDPFQLPRVEVGDWSGEVFADHLSTWFGESALDECDEANRGRTRSA